MSLRKALQTACFGFRILGFFGRVLLRARRRRALFRHEGMRYGRRQADAALRGGGDVRDLGWLRRPGRYAIERGTCGRPRPRPQPVAETATPDLRIPADAVARGPDIPLVPLPPLSRPASPATPATRPPAPPPFVPSANPTAPPVSATPSSPVPPTAPAQTTPSTETPPHTARQLLQQATVRCASLDSYIVRLTRREFLKDKAQPEEIMLFKFRKKPFSVHFKWLGDTAKGREVVYVKSGHGQQDSYETGGRRCPADAGRRRIGPVAGQIPRALRQPSSHHRRRHLPLSWNPHRPAERSKVATNARAL